MSLYDFRKALEIREQDPPFYALIMAAMLKADTINIEKLKTAFPEIHIELDQRYHSKLGLNGITGMLPEDLK